MIRLGDLRPSESMKYTALYWALHFIETEPDYFYKLYADGTKIEIKASEQVALINNDFRLPLNTYESFVELECINRLLELGYKLAEIKFEEHADIIQFKGFNIRFIEWNSPFLLAENAENMVTYKSRLISGILEYKCKIYTSGIWFDHGLFENYSEKVNLTKSVINTINDDGFIIEENRLIKYLGSAQDVVVPEGIKELASTAFWDNQSIERVLLPESLENIGGDVFYNCRNLKEVTITANVTSMGNNPFAGCPNLKLKSASSFFPYINGILYTENLETIIYCSIRGKENELIIPEGVKVIGKHAFYLCDRFQKIVLPNSLIKLDNNPFSGCTNLELVCNSAAYFIKDDVIYNGFKTAVVGTLNRIKSKRLELLEGIKAINRNAFWNCKGIETLVLPATLIDIGYNPFVGCSNINFVSKSPYFKVIDGILFNKDRSKIICYPAWKAVGMVKIPDSVITLERGAFSGCNKMTEIHLHNVSIISKSCFTNCSKLENLYCSDLVTYIGEWAFAYCTNLKEISVNEETIIDNYAFANCNPRITKRKELSNYLIESENLSSLISMQKRYQGRIDAILIDPPYNSNINYISYKDNDFNNGYLEFMQERLKLSFNLLSNKGFLIINIDEGEVKNLSELAKEIFGSGLVSIHKWKKKHAYFDINREVLNPYKEQTDYEYIIICKKSFESEFNAIQQPYIENGKILERQSKVPEVFDCFGTTSSAKDEIANIFGNRKYFSTPKPLKLMIELVRATTKKDSIVLDYFAGSGTIGQAVMALNKEDNGKRKFILVSNNESNICQKVAKVRMEKAVAKYDDKYIFLN